MGFFRRKEEKQIDYPYHRFFDKIKEETSLLTQWLHYFYKKNDEHDIRIRLLEQHAQRTHKKQDEQRLLVVEKQYAQLVAHVSQTQRRMNIILGAQEPVLQKLEEIEKRLEKQGQQHNPLYDSIKEIHKKLSLLEQSAQREKGILHQQVTSNAKERLAQKVAKKSKEYTKHTIQSFITKYGKISGLQLREIIVDEQRLCSRSTFYRLLTELEHTESIGSLHEKKEKVYFSQLEKQIGQ